MKAKSLLVAVIFSLTTFTFFAKDNPKAASYKTHEVSTLRQSSGTASSTNASDKSVPVVYFIRDISPESLVKVYQATGYKTSGKTGVKVSTGESEKANYLRPALIKNLVKDELNATIVECNTAYGGSRSNNIDHMKIARDHGFLDVANGFDLQDAEGYMTIPVKGGVRLKENYVGTHFKDYDTYLILSHFKGHAMGGFGGAIKNLSIGFASGMSCKKSGKLNIHSAGRSVTNWTRCPQDEFLESMAEAAKSVCDYMQGGKGAAFQKGLICVNVMNRLSVDCDSNPAEPDMHDIGILASLDPVALDQACVDLVYKAKDSGSLIERIESRNGIHTLEHAEKIGFGSRNYRLVEIK